MAEPDPSPSPEAASPEATSTEQNQSGAAAVAAESLERAVSYGLGLLRLLMLLLLMLFFAECVRTVDEGTVAVKLRFGRVLRDEQGRVELHEARGGFVFAWPPPIEELRVIPLGTRTLTIDEAFWPKVDRASALLEERAIPPVPALEPDSGGYNLTGDRNIIHTRWQLEYRIIDPVRYLEAAASKGEDELRAAVEQMVAATASGVILRQLAAAPVDSTLTSDPAPRILEALKAALEGEDGLPRFGVEVAALNLRAAVPPAITQGAFNRVAGVLSERKKLEAEARADAARLSAETDAEARKRLLDAGVARRREIEQARADAASLTDLLARFPDDPKGLALYLRQRRQDELRRFLGGAALTLLPEEQRGVFLIGPANEEQGDPRAPGGKQ